MQTQREAPCSDSESQRGSPPRSSGPTSGAESPPIDGEDTGAEVQYSDLFGTPELDGETDPPDRSHLDARVAGRQRARELVRRYGDDPQSLMAGIRQGMRIQYGIKEIREGGEADEG